MDLINDVMIKSYKYYLEYASYREKRRATKEDLGNHKGTILAVFIRPNENGQLCAGAAGTAMDGNRSQITTHNIDENYLRTRCKRVSKKVAKEIHPELFSVLEDWDRSTNQNKE